MYSEIDGANLAGVWFQPRGVDMDTTTAILALIAIAVVGIVLALGILRGDRRAVEDASRESPFAVSSEGMKLCPSCGFGNLVGESTCASCGKAVPG